MKNLWKAYRVWEERRWRKNIPWWERKRAKGEARYVLETTLTWGGLMVILSTSYDYFIEHDFSYFKLLISLLLYFAAGGALGLGTWRDNERRYLELLGDDGAPE